MRTTVDLPPAVHQRARAIARARGESLSKVLADLAVRGLAQVDDEDVLLEVDPDSGFPVLSIGRRISSQDVAEALDE